MELETSTNKLQAFISFYQSATKNNLHLLKDIYAQNVIFEDPAHRIEGLAALEQYFQKLYLNVNECHFQINDISQTSNMAFLTWRMLLSHPKLAKGKEQEILGCSQLKFAHDLVIYQRDYFDLGAMLYQNLPLLGPIISQIKNRLGQ